MLSLHAYLILDHQFLKYRGKDYRMIKLRNVYFILYFEFFKKIYIYIYNILALESLALARKMEQWLRRMDIRDIIFIKI